MLLCNHFVQIRIISQMVRIGMTRLPISSYVKKKQTVFPFSRRYPPTNLYQLYSHLSINVPMSVEYVIRYVHAFVFPNVQYVMGKRL